MSFQNLLNWVLSGAKFAYETGYSSILKVDKHFKRVLNKMIPFKPVYAKTHSEEDLNALMKNLGHHELFTRNVHKRSKSAELVDQDVIIFDEFDDESDDLNQDMQVTAVNPETGLVNSKTVNNNVLWTYYRDIPNLVEDT